jgi:hypothetical protein
VQPAPQASGSSSFIYLLIYLLPTIIEKNKENSCFEVLDWMFSFKG